LGAPPGDGRRSGSVLGGAALTEVPICPLAICRLGRSHPAASPTGPARTQRSADAPTGKRCVGGPASARGKMPVVRGRPCTRGASRHLSEPALSGIASSRLNRGRRCQEPLQSSGAARAPNARFRRICNTRTTHGIPSTPIKNKRVAGQPAPQGVARVQGEP
jgi:hypothetical protein